MASTNYLTIKGYVKHAQKQGKKFDLYIAVSQDGDKPIYATISFCRKAFDQLEAIKKEFGKEFPEQFSFEVKAEDTNIRRKTVFAKDENDMVRANANGEPISFDNIKLYVDGEIKNFKACDTVFDGIGEKATAFGR